MKEFYEIRQNIVLHQNKMLILKPSLQTMDPGE